MTDNPLYRLLTAPENNTPGRSGMNFITNSDNRGRVQRAHHAQGDVVTAQDSYLSKKIAQEKANREQHRQGDVITGKKELVHMTPQEMKLFKQSGAVKDKTKQYPNLAKKGQGKDTKIGLTNKADLLDELVHGGEKIINPKTGLGEYVSYGSKRAYREAKYNKKIQRLPRMEREFFRGYNPGKGEISKKDLSKIFFDEFNNIPGIYNKVELDKFNYGDPKQKGDSCIANAIYRFKKYTHPEENLKDYSSSPELYDQAMKHKSQDEYTKDLVTKMKKTREYIANLGEAINTELDPKQKESYLNEKKYHEGVLSTAMDSIKNITSKDKANTKNTLNNLGYENLTYDPNNTYYPKVNQLADHIRKKGSPLFISSNPYNIKNMGHTMLGTGVKFDKDRRIYKEIVRNHLTKSVDDKNLFLPDRYLELLKRKMQKYKTIDPFTVHSKIYTSDSQSTGRQKNYVEEKAGNARTYDPVYHEMNTKFSLGNKEDIEKTKDNLDKKGATFITKVNPNIGEEPSSSYLDLDTLLA